MKKPVIFFLLILILPFNFILTAGEYWVPHIDLTPGVSSLFSGIIILAIIDNTNIDIDLDHNGTSDLQFQLQHGERREVTLPLLKKGAIILTNAPVVIYYNYYFDDPDTYEDSEYSYHIPPVQRLGKDYWIPGPIRLVSILGINHFTTVSVDINADGIIDQVKNINYGQTWEIENIYSNLHITSSDTIMVVAINFEENRYGYTYAYTANPESNLGDTYYLPRSQRYQLSPLAHSNHLKITGIQDTTILLIKDQLFKINKGGVINYPAFDTLLIRSNRPVFPVYISDVQAEDPKTQVMRHYSHAFPCFPDLYAPKRAMRFLIDRGKKQSWPTWPEQVLAITSFENDNTIKAGAKVDKIIDKEWTLQAYQTLYIYNGDIPQWDEQSLLEITSTHKIQVILEHFQWQQGKTEKASSMMYSPLGIKGDLNYDGKIDTLDTNRLIDFMLDKIVPDEFTFWVADQNDDKKLNVLDFQRIVNLIIRHSILKIHTHEINFTPVKNSASLEITNTGRDTINFEISKFPDKSWISSINPQKNKGNTTVTILADESKLTGMSDSCWLFINSNGGRDFVKITITKTSNEHWKVPIAISSGKQTYFRTFGASILATDQFDSGIDLVTAPPGLDFYSYFELATFPYYLDTDIRKWERNQKADKTWYLNLKNVRQVATLSWSASALPPAGYFKISGNNFSIDMRKHQSLSINSDALIKIEFSDFVEYIFDFPSQGWYLISLPVIPPDSSLKVLFPEALAAFAHENKSYMNADKLIPGKGYWLSILKPMKVIIRGRLFDKYSGAYDTDWHLIGAVNDTTDFKEPHDIPDGAVIVCYGWNSISQRYYEVFPNGTGKLIPGEGYWIGAIQPCTLKIGSDGFALSEILPSIKPQNGAWESFPPPPPEMSSISDMSTFRADELAIKNFPNPFNATTKIIYSLPQPGHTCIYIYNTLGQRVKTLSNSYQTKGMHDIIWNGNDENGLPVGNGLYFCRIEQLGHVKIQKMVVLK